jgi:hypothetical protein
MVTLVINEETVQARRFLEYVRTLSFAKVVEEEKDFRKAVKDCSSGR